MAINSCHHQHFNHYHFSYPEGIEFWLCHTHVFAEIRQFVLRLSIRCCETVNPNFQAVNYALGGHYVTKMINITFYTFGWWWEVCLAKCAFRSWWLYAPCPPPCTLWHDSDRTITRVTRWRTNYITNVLERRCQLLFEIYLYRRIYRERLPR